MRGSEEAETDSKSQRAWMLEQKRKEGEEAAEVEKQADKESENDSGREEEDGSLEDWTEKELAGECSTEEAAVEAVPAKRRMALLKIGERRSWPGNAALKRQL